MLTLAIWSRRNIKFTSYHRHAIFSLSFTLLQMQSQWSVMHTELVLFIFTFIQQKKQQNEIRISMKIHYVASTIHMFLNAYILYVCVSINDIIRDNRTGSQSFSAWILHLFKQKKKIRESPLFFFLCCPFVNSVHLYFGRVNVWFERNKNMIWAAATPRSWKEFDTSDHKWCIYHLIGVYAQSKACTIMNKLAPNICIGRGTAHSIEDLKRRSFLCWWWISSFSSLFNDSRV